MYSTPTCASFTRTERNWCNCSAESINFAEAASRDSSDMALSPLAKLSVATCECRSRDARTSATRFEALYACHNDAATQPDLKTAAARRAAQSALVCW